MAASATPPRKGLQPNRDFAGAAAVLERSYGAFPTPRRGTQSKSVINVDTVQLLGTPQRFRYRGHAFTIRTVPYLLGIELEYIREEVIRLMPEPTTRANLLALQELFRRGFHIMWVLTRPPGWWLLLSHWRNPFRRATYGEFVAMASFFSECQMLQPDLALDITPGSPTSRTSRPKMLLTAWRNSRKPSPPGSLEQDIRSRIITTASASAGSKSNTAVTSSP